MIYQSSIFHAFVIHRIEYIIHTYIEYNFYIDDLYNLVVVKYRNKFEYSHILIND
jgi:hypothetical protein